MRAVLADTGPLYALVDPDDAFHEQARDEAERLRDGGLTVVVGYPTLCEAHALVLRKLGSPAARGWLEDVTTGCAVVNPARAHYEAAAARLEPLVDQAITLFDALAAELGAHLELPVWTYDHHFDVMGVEVWR